MVHRLRRSGSVQLRSDVRLPMLLLPTRADACRAAARDELRKGAHCIKVMASGGVASPTDR
jgi:imidazolonepropionase-like amidohydrolase